ncbi:MAG: 30S ribosome-binding factor RbfA [Planctomycetota bacterium]
MSRRQERLSSALRREVQAVIDRGFQDPRIRGLITVTEVLVSEDARQATAHVSVLPEEAQELTIHGLRDAARYIRREAADRLRTRQMPKLSIKLDTSLKKQAGVLDALAKARAEFAEEGDSREDQANDPGQPGLDIEPGVREEAP